MKMIMQNLEKCKMKTIFLRKRSEKGELPTSKRWS